MNWIIATSNRHKAAEIVGILEPAGVAFRALDDLRESPEIEETGGTFATNAVLKAVGWASVFGGVALADDSGLEVDALEGAPGVHSSRFSGEEATDETNNQKLRSELVKLPDAPRTARFCCVIAIACRAEDAGDIEPFASARLPDEACSPEDVGPSDVRLVGWGDERFAVMTFEGHLDGLIAEEARGTGGFGYDPYFRLPDGRHLAELSPAEKNEISHRAQALRQLESLLANSNETA